MLKSHPLEKIIQWNADSDSTHTHTHTHTHTQVTSQLPSLVSDGSFLVEEVFSSTIRAEFLMGGGGGGSCVSLLDKMLGLEAVSEVVCTAPPVDNATHVVSNMFSSMSMHVMIHGNIYDTCVNEMCTCVPMTCVHSLKSMSIILPLQHMHDPHSNLWPVAASLQSPRTPRPCRCLPT